MNGITKDDYGKLILRVTVGALMLFHGVAKIKYGIDFIKGAVGFLAYGVYLGEIVAPIALIAGIKTRISALIVAGTMVFAIVIAHMGDIFALSKHGGWAIELPMFFLLASIAIIFLGGGKLSLDKN